MMAFMIAAAVSGPLPIADPIFTLGDAAVRALIVAIAVGAGLRLLGARNVLAQKAAWGMVLAGALLMPLIAPLASTAAWLPSEAKLVLPARSWLAALSAWREKSRTPTHTQALSNAAPDPIPATVAQPREMMAENLTTPSLTGSSQPDRFPAPAISSSYTPGSPMDKGSALPSERRIVSLATLGLLLYCGVCAALLLRLFYGLGAAFEIWWSAEPVRIEPATDLAAGLRLRSTRAVSSPVTVGSGILLPADYDEWDSEKLRIVLAHERSHVRQGDFYLQALAGLYTALFWFSPLGWWLKRKLSDLSEAISDRAGLDEAASNVSYARVLLEFAALPRPTQIGVAMARKGRISHRIERLLNENLFRQAFAGGRRRLLAALLLVPVALFAATALLRVEAAQTLQQPTDPQGPIVVQSHPESVPDPAAPPTEVAPVAISAYQAPAAPPPTQATPAVAPSAPAAPRSAVVAPVAPAPPVEDEQDVDSTAIVTDKGNSSISVSSSHNGKGYKYAHAYAQGANYAYSYSSDGDSYAVVSGKDTDHVRFSGEWHNGRGSDIEKARQMVHGDFLWFTRNGKSYVVDDAQTVATIQAMYKPMEELGRQQEELGRQQEALGRQQEELGRKQEEASIPTPDLSKEMADLNAAMAKLQAKKGSTVSQQELADLEGRLGELQGRLGSLQGEVGSKQGEFGRQQGQLGAQQGRLGAQEGRLGAEQGRLAREADIKIKGIMDESLKNGKAKPVE